MAEIRFGALCKPLHKQLDVPPSVLVLEQKLADAVTLCNIHGILTGREVSNARKRTVKRIEKTLQEAGLYEKS